MSNHTNVWLFKSNWPIFYHIVIIVIPEPYLHWWWLKPLVIYFAVFSLHIIQIHWCRLHITEQIYTNDVWSRYWTSFPWIILLIYNSCALCIATLEDYIFQCGIWFYMQVFAFSFAKLNPEICFLHVFYKTSLKFVALAEL